MDNWAFLKLEVPSVFILGCTCHSVLCVTHAFSHFLFFLKQFVRNVCCYFARSSKRNHQVQLIQEVKDIVHSPKKRMLKLSQTRWLSKEKIITWWIEQWDALTHFFGSWSENRIYEIWWCGRDINMNVCSLWLCPILFICSLSREM